MIRQFHSSSEEQAKGIYIFSGASLEPGMCNEAAVETVSLQPEGDEVHFEQRGVVQAYASDTCSTRAAKEQLAGKPCNHLLAMRGKRVASI